MKTFIPFSPKHNFIVIALCFFSVFFSGQNVKQQLQRSNRSGLTQKVKAEKILDQSPFINQKATSQSRTINLASGKKVTSNSKKKESSDDLSSYSIDSKLADYSRLDFKKGEIFNKFNAKQEILEKRDKSSKHFQNDNGTITAVIGTDGNFHYKEEGKWKAIDREIILNSTGKNSQYKFVNSRNSFKSYYSSDASKGLISEFLEGEFVEGLNKKAIWMDKDYKILSQKNISSSLGIIAEDKVTYSNVLPSVDLVYHQQNDGRKMDYIINNSDFFTKTPANSKYLAFAEDLKIPAGTTIKEEKNEEGKIIILNVVKNGNIIFRYDLPKHYDSKGKEVTSYYKLVQNTIYTIVDLDWIKSGLTYPIYIDPTVTVYPTATGNYNTGVIDANAIKTANNDIYVGMRPPITGTGARRFMRGWASFNVTSIPDAATIDKVGFGCYIGLNTFDASYGEMARVVPITSGIPNTATGGTLYNMCGENIPDALFSIGAGGTGNQFINITTVASTFVKNSLVSNIFSLGFAPIGEFDPGFTEQVGIYGSTRTQATSGGKPYLTIDYTVTSPCSGTPTGGTTLLTPTTGTYGTTFTGTVTGSTSGVSGLTYQWESAPTAGGTWAIVAGATSANANFTAPNAINTTYYRRKITCSGNSSYSTAVAFTTTCTPSHINGNAPDSAGGINFGYIGISNVNIGTIDNTTGYRNAKPAYNNYYPSQSTNISSPTSYTLSVTYKDDGGYYTPANVNKGEIGAWIDWNNDGDFEDANEFLGAKVNVTNNQIVTFTVTIPAGTAVGAKRLRVRSAFNGEALSSIDACTVKEYGETEDYKLEVTAPVTCDPITATTTKNIICPGESVNLSVTTSGTGYSYTWYTDFNDTTNTGTIVSGPSTNPLFPVAPSQSKIYTVVATKTGCFAKSLIVVVVTSTPTAILVSPTSAISCLGEVVKLSVTDGGIIPTTILNSDFNDESSVTWTTSSEITPADINPDFGNWGYWYTTDPNYYGNFDGTTFVVIDAYNIGPGHTLNYSTLDSPPLSFGDYSDVTLTFQHHFSKNENAVGQVQISTDGGNIWTTLPSQTYTTSTTADVSVPLTTYAGNRYVLLRFNFSAPYRLNNNYWAVDNIKITGVPLASKITWSPVTGLYNDKAKTTSYVADTNAKDVFASPDVTTTYTVSASTTVGCPSKNQITITNGNQNWNNGSDSNWDTVANWAPLGVPTASQCVNIPNNTKKPIILKDTNAFAKNLTIQSGGQLTVNGNLTVSDFVKNKGLVSDLVIESDGNLIQINPSKIINEGDVTAKRAVTGLVNDPIGKKVDYVYWSSPVAGQQTKGAGGFSPGTNPARFYYYLESNDRFYETGDPTFKPGRGYAVQAEGNQGPSPFTAPYNKTYEFKGTPNNGDISFPIIRSANNPAVHGYNLVGNPYPSNIIFDELYLGNSTLIYNTAWFWTNAVYAQYQQGSSYGGNNYAVYNGTGGNHATVPKDVNYNSGKVPNGIITVGQGFLVQKKDVGTDPLVFKNSYPSGNKLRVSTTGEFFQKGATEKNRFWVSLLSPSTLVNSQLIGYVAGATNDYEQDFDAEAFDLSSDLFYSIIPTKKLLIQGKSEAFTNEDKVVLGANFFTNGSYTVALDKAEGIFNGNQTIYLKDKQEGIITNLSEGSYTFTATKGDNTGRFEIIYKPEAILATGDVTKDQLVVYKAGNDFVVKSSTKKITALDVYDAAGRLIYTAQPMNTEAVIPAENLINSVYVLKIDRNGEISTKKIIK